MLRQHPQIHWPPGVQPNPPWAAASREPPDPLHIILSAVELVEPDGPKERHLALTGTYRGNIYHTTLTADDAALLNSLFELLRKCVGEPIGEIGRIAWTAHST